jgi:hypothetical protein
MKVGFTGTRRGMTMEQQMTLYDLLSRFGAEDEGHHGDCVGADDQFHSHCGRKRMKRHVHLPVDEAHRAFVKGADVIYEPLTHFARNRGIVNATDMLIATPWQTERPPKGTGGGTWYTVEYALKVGKPVTIIWPDGSLTMAS